jgi:glycosyltransferase involved in cell wall biosynthesis
MKVAIIGTVGLPANYGGFETLVENLITHKTNDSISYCVYCSSKNYAEKLREYKGARLVWLPLKANGIQSIPYDIISIVHAVFSSHRLLILGTSGCIVLPFIRLFSRKHITVNIDGLEHRRQKWGKAARMFLKFSEGMAVRFANVVIADNKAIQDYVQSEYGKASQLIEYGGDHAIAIG